MDDKEKSENLSNDVEGNNEPSSEPDIVPDYTNPLGDMASDYTANDYLDLEAEKQKFERMHPLKNKSSFLSGVLEWVVALGIAVVVALLLRNYVFVLVKVSGPSMLPTLYNGDSLFVRKFMYTPQKGDIVIFTPASAPDRPYVKRVIATAGDRVYIDFENNTVEVNGNVLREDYIKEPTRRGMSENYIRGLIGSGQYSRENPIVIEDGYIFVMGDNRNNSSDSRTLGPVPITEVMGKASFMIFRGL